MLPRTRLVRADTLSVPYCSDDQCERIGLDGTTCCMPSSGSVSANEPKHGVCLGVSYQDVYFRRWQAPSVRGILRGIRDLRTTTPLLSLFRRAPSRFVPADEAYHRLSATTKREELGSHAA